MGKSALLSDLPKNADDFCICRAGGVESEMELAYAGLQQLCRPLSGHNVELTTLHRNVLDQVFGLTEGAPPERFLVGIAALDLVATAAKKQPIVWLVDDAQWIDQASMQAIGFVGRRLLAERVAILIATRDVSDENELAGLPELRIGGLNTEDAGRLFDSVVSGPMDPLVRDRVISETRGNPLALLELPRAWTTAEMVEGLSESAGIPLTGRLEFAFAKRCVNCHLTPRPCSHLQQPSRRATRRYWGPPLSASEWIGAPRLPQNAPGYSKLDRECTSGIHWCGQPPTAVRPLRSDLKCIAFSRRWPTRSMMRTVARGIGPARQSVTTRRSPPSLRGQQVGPGLAVVCWRPLRSSNVQRSSHHTESVEPIGRWQQRGRNEMPGHLNQRSGSFRLSTPSHGPSCAPRWLRSCGGKSPLTSAVARRLPNSC